MVVWGGARADGFRQPHSLLLVMYRRFKVSANVSVIKIKSMQLIPKVAVERRAPAERVLNLNLF